MKLSNYYFDIDKICSYFKLDKDELISMLNSDKDKIIVRDNVLNYKDVCYINIKGLLYIAYMYRPYSDVYDMFLQLTRNIDNLYSERI